MCGFCVKNIVCVENGPCRPIFRTLLAPDRAKIGQHTGSSIFLKSFHNNHSRLDQTFQDLVYTDITDHYPIIHIDYDKIDNSPEMYLIRRNLPQRNRLCNEIATLDWSSIYNEIDTQNVFTLT